MYTVQNANRVSIENQISLSLKSDKISQLLLKDLLVNCKKENFPNVNEMPNAVDFKWK